MASVRLAHWAEFSWEAAGGTVAAVTGLYLLGRWITSRRARSEFPPGPRGLPVIGNLFDMPNAKEWLVYAEWAKKYGDIVGVRMPGTSIVFLNKEEDIKALFSARAANYSNRLSTTMIRMSGWDTVLGLTNIGEYFRAQRRLMLKLLGSQAIKKTIPVYEQLTREAIINLIHKRGEVQSHLKLAIGKLVLRLAYGYEVVDSNDRMLHYADIALESAFYIMRPDWIVNALPFLRYLPSWLPGMSFKNIATESRILAECSHDEPFNWVKSQIAAGIAQPSFALDILSDPNMVVDEAIIKEVLNNLYVAGADTMNATISWFILAMSLFPDAQRRAQEEIDALTGGIRLPCMDDRASLPYLDALFKEVLRWNAVANLGMLPHVSLAEDFYKGFRFPEGTVFMANVWSVLHDSTKYPHPFDFKPERFLDQPNGELIEGVQVNEDPNHFAFGFGLRICPGRLLADSVVWSLMAQALATCKISTAKYMDSTVITTSNVEYTSGVVSYPLPFTCKIVSRSDQAEMLLVE
ncbi:cytochrome P450 [Auriculariales sp. MPI-PUGE-AT-0066]|nr:cytochrome P450 [Auriculariales sp. MPI-PUGE-AT-0066]